MRCVLRDAASFPHPMREAKRLKSVVGLGSIYVYFVCGLEVAPKTHSSTSVEDRLDYFVGNMRAAIQAWIALARSSYPQRSTDCLLMTALDFKNLIRTCSIE